MIQVRDNAGNDRLWPFSSKSATLRGLENAFRASLGSSGRLADHKAGLASSGKLTTAGVAAEGERFARQELLPSIARGHLALQKARRHVKDELSRLKPAAADKSDLVGVFKRESIRDELRALSREQRDAYLTRFSAELDWEVALAALETVDMPWHKPEQRFISEQTRNALARTLIASEHGDALAAIEDVQAAIDYVAPTLETARKDVQANLAMNDVEFQQALQSEAAKSPPVWLRRIGDDVRVIVPGGSARLATEEEKAVGVYFSNIDEFNAALAAVA